MKHNPITPTIAYDQEGKHHVFLRLPYSRDDSAWGSVMLPITVVRGGSGPVALLTGPTTVMNTKVRLLCRTWH